MIDTLEIDGLRLVPYAAEHDVQTVRWLNDPLLQRGFGLLREITLESHRAWRSANKDVLMWAITDEAGDHCGNVLLDPVMARRSAYLQVYVGSQKCLRKGIAFRALGAVLTHAFSSLGLHRVWLHTLPENLAAEALYTKLGFLREGVEREALPRGERFVDQYRWSLLAHEWKGTVGKSGR